MSLTNEGIDPFTKLVIRHKLKESDIGKALPFRPMVSNPDSKPKNPTTSTFRMDMNLKMKGETIQKTPTKKLEDQSDDDDFLFSDDSNDIK